MMPKMRNPDKMVFGCVYVAIAENGLIKVGNTDNPKTRTISLRIAFDKLGTKLSEIRFCDEVHGYWSVENDLVRDLQSRLKRSHGREWFLGGDYEQIYALAKSLTQMRQEKNIADEKARIEAREKALADAKQRKQKKMRSSEVFSNIFHTLIS